MDATSVNHRGFANIWKHFPQHTGNEYNGAINPALLCHIDAADSRKHGKHLVFLAFKIHEKEEDEMNEKNENANCLNEEPLITADQVSLSKTDMILMFMLKSVLRL